MKTKQKVVILRGTGIGKTLTNLKKNNPQTAIGVQAQRIIKKYKERVALQQPKSKNKTKMNL